MADKRSSRANALAVSIAIALAAGFSMNSAAMAAPASAAPTRAQSSDQQTPSGDAGTSQAASKQSKAEPASPSTSGNEKQAETLGTVVVTGIVESLQHSVELKKIAPLISDSITAEHIGELPDVTIADSLQRITGVQINRQGGQGTTVGIRGLPQVGMTLNGGAFITADNITSDQPNFTSIPAQLISGVDVFKSATADKVNNGITGAINLRTQRPWDLKPGWTLSGAMADSYGTAAKKHQPTGNFLAGYNGDGRWGALLSVAASKMTVGQSAFGNDESGGRIYGENAASATSSAGFLGAFGKAPVPGDIAQLGGGNVDVNGDGKSDGAFFGSQTGYAGTRLLANKRLGANASIQGDLGNGFTVTADAFFAKLDQFSSNNEFEIFSQTFQGATFVPVVAQNTGAQVSPFGAKSSALQNFYTTQVYKKWPGDIETQTSGTKSNSTSRNFNVQLDYDDGGPFTGNLRLIDGSADKNLVGGYIQLSNADGSAWPNDPVNAAPPNIYVFPSSLGGLVPFNPGGIAPNTIPVTYDMRGSQMLVTLPPGFQEHLNDPANYGIKGAVWDNAYRRSAAMHIAKLDGHYDIGQLSFLDDFKLNFGVRSEIRAARNDQLRYAAPLYAGNGASDPQGCFSRWQAADVVLNGGGVPGACTAGDANGFYRASVLTAGGTAGLPPVLKDNMHLYTGLGGSQGLNIVSFDPNIFKNPLGLANALYPGMVPIPNPASTWAVTLKERDAYLQGDFRSNMGGVDVSGNVGMRLIHSNLQVTQFVPGLRQAYGLPAAVAGTAVTAKSYNDWLPSANVTFGFTPELLLRLAYSKNMQPLDLSQWGGGFSLNYQIDTSAPGAAKFVAVNGSSSGNPNLEPWRSTNYNASLEYYIGPTSIVSVAGFYIKVASSISSGSVNQCNIPATVPGACIPITSLIQENGHALKGLEVNYNQSLTFLPGLLQNTGFGANFTYAPSTGGGIDLAGRKIPFQDNSKYTGNLVLWYQDEKLGVRVAGNYRSKRAVSDNYLGIAGGEEYQAPVKFVNLSVDYKIMPHLQVYAQAENLTKQHQRFYLVWPGQLMSDVSFERRYTLGVRATF